jgi:hypothetical protein
MIVPSCRQAPTASEIGEVRNTALRCGAGIVASIIE